MAIWLNPDEKVKVVEVVNGVKHIKASLLADTDTEVKANGTSCANIDGMDATDVLAKGSDAFTSSKEYLFLNSNGTWE